MLITAAYVIAAILIVGFDLALLWLLFSGAPYIPTSYEGLEKILAFAKIQKGMKVADIGSGDGRILVILARAGAEAEGFELNPLLVWWSRRKIKQAKLESRAHVSLKNLWNVDFSSFDVVTVFGAPQIMNRLQKKLHAELKAGARVISIGFQFPNWPLKEKDSRVFLYEKS